MGACMLPMSVFVLFSPVVCCAVFFSFSFCYCYCAPHAPPCFLWRPVAALLYFIYLCVWLLFCQDRFFLPVQFCRLLYLFSDARVFFIFVFKVCPVFLYGPPGIICLSLGALEFLGARQRRGAPERAPSSSSLGLDRFSQ